MHSTNKTHKSHYSLFKSNKSQASLLSNQSYQDRPLQYQPSPFESPLASPAHGTFPLQQSAASSPLSPEDRDRDDSLAQTYQADEAKFYQQNSIPRRTQSQRTPPLQPRSNLGPTINLVGPGQSGAGSNTIEEDFNPDSYYSQQPPAKTEPKKKRRFFGIGESSSSRDHIGGLPSNTTKGLGRSISVRNKPPPPQVSTNAKYDPSQQHWPSGSTSAKLPSITSNREETGQRVNSAYEQYSTANPLTPPKDPPKSPGFPEQNYFENQTAASSSSTAASQSQSAEPAGFQKTPVWERIGRPPNHLRTVSNDQQPQQFQAFHPTPSSASSVSSHPLPSRSAQDLLYQNTHYPQGSRPSSRQSYDPPTPPPHHPYHQGISSFQSPALYTEGTMAPTAQTHSGGRSIDLNQQMQQSGSGRDLNNHQQYMQAQGGNPSGQQSGQYGAQLSASNAQGGSYRNAPGTSPMMQQNSNSEQGRSSPPPSKSRDDLSTLDVNQLSQRYEELNDKYRKVKKYYFDKDAQVQQLQNTLAHQRLAQSRTSLDDNEYATRFSRLDGAINNLAFNIRKDWHVAPQWLAPYVNREAPTIVTKEMTAVGRAYISRWLVDELFDRYFHPGLEPEFSCRLKTIERNLRRFAAPTPSDEEKEALLSKISNWRLATLDGLADMFNSPEEAQHRDHLTKYLVGELTKDLTVHLKDPASPGLEAGVVGIVELAVGIAANLPLESRDVFVEYIMPGASVTDAYMRVEGALPALTNPGENEAGDRASVASGDGEKDESGEAEGGKEQGATQQQQQQQQQQQGRKKGILGGLMNKKPVAAGTPPGSSGREAPKEERVRFAAFMSVEVRGKNMLIKAPVYI